MYFLNKFCCVCMNTSDLKLMFDVDSDGISHYNKLTSSVAEMNFEEMNNQRLICEECCVILNTVYAFRQMCLRSKANLITYISQLRTYGHVSGTLSVRLEDIRHGIKVAKQEIYIKCENEDYSSSFEESIPRSKLKAESYEESVNFSASVKQECESEDASCTRDYATADHVGERGRGDVKVEEDGYLTTMEDENYTELSMMGFEENSTVELKEESMSDREQDGSTSQADACTSGEPKKRKKSKTKTEQKAIRGQHKCELCEKCFIHKNDFTRHLRIHSGERPYECEICKRNFNEKSNLTKHMLLHSGEKRYECEICKKNFYQNSHLTQHLLLHSGERPYECEICKKTYNQKGNLTRHLLMHSGKRSYECDICKKRFIHKNNLTSHMLIHSGERSYECEICKKSFTHKGILTKHMRIHSDERPYECEICRKSFKRKSSLTQHVRIHSGVRPYKCDICEKSYIQRHHLIAHHLVSHTLVK